MVRRLCLIVLTMACVGMTAGATRVLAQAPGGQTREQAAAVASVPLKVSIAIVRQKGSKETGRLPFELWVNTGSTATLRLGSDVPVPQTTFAAESGGKSVPTTSYTYRSLGTSITCDARDVGDGRFRVDLSIEDSQMAALETKADAQGMRPSFQSFRATTQAIARDGQTVQHSLATDKVSGEVVKVEITVQVIK